MVQPKSVGDFSAALLSAATPGAATILLQQSLHAQNLFFYGAILDASASLMARDDAFHASSDFQTTLATVQMLSAGTVTSVLASRDAGQTPSGSIVENHTLWAKLQQLTLLSVCHSSNSRSKSGVLQLPYSVVLDALQLPHTDDGVRQMEDVVLSAVSNNLLSAKLDQRLGFIVGIRDVQARDIPMQQKRSAAASLASTLESWAAKCAAEVTVLESDVVDAEVAFMAQARQKQALLNAIVSDKQSEVLAREFADRYGAEVAAARRV